MALKPLDYPDPLLTYLVKFLKLFAHTLSTGTFNFQLVFLLCMLWSSAPCSLDDAHSQSGWAVNFILHGARNIRSIHGKKHSCLVAAPQ